MTQLERHPAYLLIEDQLDAIGQKCRVQRLLRGAMLFVCWAVVTTVAAALVAHLTGQGRWTSVVLALWIAWLGASALWWVARPLLLRPRPLQVARLIETRVPKLNNGLTNSVLLARADDLQQSPWLPAIFDEILAATRDKPLGQAVKFGDLRPLALRLCCVTLPVILLAVLFNTRIAHGWQQLFRPQTFVPQAGTMKILDVRPGDVTLVAGQALEITVLAEGPDTPEAKLIFDNPKLGAVPVIATPADANQARYTYRVEHVDEPMRYRVEVGATQSDWFTVTLVKQVKLAELTLKILPPAYTGKPSATIVLKDPDIGKTPLSILQGSQVELSALADVPVNGAMLALGKATPVALGAEGGKRFVGSFSILDDTSLCILFTAGADQIIASLPEPPLAIHCAKDAAPQIEMKWPTQDLAVDPKADIKLAALVRDDYGLSNIKVLMGVPDASAANTQAAPGAGPLMGVVAEHRIEPAKGIDEFSHVLEVRPELRKHGLAIFVQLEATDNRTLSTLMKDGGPQSNTSARYEIKFRDPQQIAKEEKEKIDRLRKRLMELLKLQQDLHTKAVSWKPGQTGAMTRIAAGQTDLRSQMQQTADTFEFDADTRVVQKTLLLLVHNPAKDAVDLATSITTEPADKQQLKLGDELQSRQRRIIMTLENLLALLNASPELTTQPTTRKGGDLENEKEAYKKLMEDLQKFMQEEKRILDQTAPLAKKPVDNWDEKDKKLLEDLLASQEKMDAFMQAKVHDFSKLAEQDMANAALLKELMEVYSEVTMAKGALKDQATEIAVAAEEMGVELAKELSSNLEKWLMDTPDRLKWTQEDPLTKQDIPMAELPKELEDMVGELMEEQEDIFDEAEDMNANWADSLDKGAGWDAMDGPIANMSAKGVTGNAQPNDNEMGGRSGEGRTGRSQGEMVEDTASGKGGRNTPTRLDPTPFQQGQIKDESKDPTGGATGGGKLSGLGGAGLEGPVGPKQRDEYLKRLAQKQAELRNSAERLNLQYQLGRYDNFKLLESIALMRRVESDLNSNRYQTALRRKDILLDDLDTSRLLLGGQIHVQHDTTPTMSKKLEDQIHDALKTQLPAAWSDALKEYYKKLSEE